MPKIVARAIRGRRISPDFDAIVEEWSRVLDKQIKPDLIKLFNLTVKDWEEHKVSFRARKRITDKEIVVYVWPHGDEEKKRIYGFITKGTKVRWALMSPDWQSKTQPSVIPSGPGSGYVALKGKGQMKRAGLTRPQPGIKARDFEGQIGKQYQPFFSRYMENAARRAVRKANRGS